MMYHGEKRYLDNAKLVTKAVKHVADFVEKNDELTLIGDPKICVVSFTYKKNQSRIYHVDNVLRTKGWNVSALQYPPALHISMVIGFANKVK